METAKNNVVHFLMIGVALIMALYHLVYTQWMLIGPIQHQNLHYMMALVLVFLWLSPDRRQRSARPPSSY